MRRKPNRSGKLVVATLVATAMPVLLASRSGATDDPIVQEPARTAAPTQRTVKVQPRQDVRVPGGELQVERIKPAAPPVGEMVPVDVVRRQAASATLGQLTPIFGAELRLMTATANPTPAQRRAIALEAGKSLKAYAGVPVQANFHRRPQFKDKSDQRRIVREFMGLAAIGTLTPDQYARYQQEEDNQDKAREEVVVLNVVAQLDRVLFLNRHQRDALVKSLRTQWYDDTFPSLESLTVFEASVPLVPARLIDPVLTEPQRRVYAEQPKLNFGSYQGTTDAGRVVLPGAEDDDPDLKAALAEDAHP